MDYIIRGYTNDLAMYLIGRGPVGNSALGDDPPKRSDSIEPRRHSRQLSINSAATSTPKVDCKQFELDLKEVRRV